MLEENVVDVTVSSESIKKAVEVYSKFNYRAADVLFAKENKVEQKIYDNIEEVDLLSLCFYGNNRAIGKPHVRKLICAIARSGYISPIIIQQDNIIIDGQHRAVAGYVLGYRVQAIRINVSNMTVFKELLQSFNTTMKNWSNKDWKEMFQSEKVKVFGLLEDVRARIGSGVPMDSVLSIFLNKNSKYSNFKKLPLEKMDEIYLDTYEVGVNRLHKFQHISSNLREYLDIKSYIFMDGLAKHIISNENDGIDGVDIDSFVNTIRQNGNFGTGSPQTAGEWKASIAECFG